MRATCLCLAVLLFPAAARCQEIANEHTRVAAIHAGGGCVGFDVQRRDGERWLPVAEVRWSSLDRIRCAGTAVTRGARGIGGVLRCSGFEAPASGTPRFGADTAVSVSLTAGDAYPRVRLRVGIAALDEARWRASWRNVVPFYFLRCSLPPAADGRQMLYQHGILYPGPEIDPYPITMGPMKGDWCERWSYAPALGAAPIPVTGLWSPASRLFVAYEFGEALFGDRSAKHLASSYCAGLEDHPRQFICLSWPYAEGWTHLRLPTAPATVETTFRLLYASALPSDDDPNRFVLRTMAARYADRMPPAPRMNDMAWLRQGLEASQTRFLHDLGLATQHPIAGSAPIVLVPYERCEKAFFDPGAVQLIAHQTGKACRYAWSVGDTAGLAELKRQIEMLIPEAVEERYGADVCYVWKHPLHGQFKAVLGGANATGTRHMFNWGIASAMLWFYRYEHDPRYLRFVDGMVKWTRHCLYDRAGMADLPWAVFSMGAANGGEFLLDYYYTFRDDPARKDLAEEAWRLAEAIVYRNSYPYLGDSLDGDTLDPSFLLQAVNSAYWIGAVTWGEMGRVPEMWIRMYLETGDPLLKYLLRGCLERFYIGTLNSAGGYTENLLVFQGGGMSGGWGGNNFRWLAEPLGSAVMQVDVGPRAAIAFCKGTRALDVAEFAYARPANYRFRVVGIGPSTETPAGPFDIMVTSPHESISGKAVGVNGRALPSDRYVIGSDGVNALIRGVRVGDTIVIGPVATRKDEAREGEAPAEPASAKGAGYARTPLPARRAFHPVPSADWRQHDLRKLARERVDTRWSGPWGGLIPGPLVASGVAVTLLEPAANAGIGAVSLRSPVTLDVSGSGPHVVLIGLAKAPKPVFGGTVVAECTVRYADGSVARSKLFYEDGSEVRRGMEWYDKEWWIRVYAVGDARKPLRSIRLSGSTLLFAVSSPVGARARRVAVAMREAAAVRRRRQAYTTIQMPTRAATAAVPWLTKLPYRFLVRIGPSPRGSTSRTVRIRQDLAMLLAQVGVRARPDTASLRAFVIAGPGTTPREAPCQFCPDDPSSPARGDLLLRLPAGAGQERLVAVYFGSAESRRSAGPVRLTRDGSRATLSNGRMAITFELSGEGHGPRIVGLSLNGGDNLLGPTGHDAGYAHLCACQDGVTWYDFGALQDSDATMEVVDSGPVATTVRFGGLRIYGEGSSVPFAGVGTPGARRASVKGVADWYVRLYADEARADNWVAYTMTTPDTGWTRTLEVRYAPRAGLPGSNGGVAWQAGSWAKQGGLAVVALDQRPDRSEAAPYYTDEDGNLIGVRLARTDGIGRYVSDVWRVLVGSAGASPSLSVEAEPLAIEQYAVERRVGGRIVRRAPVAAPLPDDGADAWSQRVAGDIVASFEPGSPDRADGMRNKDNAADEGASLRARIGEVWCMTPGTTSSGALQQFAYFDIAPEVADRVRGRPVFVAIEYLDIGRATVEMHYDSLDASVSKSATPGAFKDAVGTLRMGASGKRKTSVFALRDPRFQDHCNGADIRLAVREGPFHITRVALIVPPDE